MKFTQPNLPDLADVVELLKGVWENRQISNFGPLAQQFEGAAGNYLDAHAAVVSSGTTGLTVALYALGIGHGDKVAVPSFTFSATAQAVLHTGAVPVYVEIDATLNMDVDDLSRILARHPDIRCVVPVHMFGLPVDSRRIDAVVRNFLPERTIEVVYDAAHAFGSNLDSLGTCSVFSLSGTKPLVAVEGGLLVSRDAELTDRARSIRNYGIASNYNATSRGLNGKFSELNAAVGLLNLEKFPDYLLRRRTAAMAYIDSIKSRTAFTPQTNSEASNFKVMCVLAPLDNLGLRDTAVDRLSKSGIETRTYFYPPLHQQTHFEQFADRVMPMTDRYARSVLCLPFQTNTSQGEIDLVVDILSAIR